MHASCVSFISSRRPEDYIRAARHYERASHLMISHQVETANCHVFPYFPLGNVCLPLGIWVQSMAPARIDLAGAWSDTPPICYEQGGVVMNLAIQVSHYYHIVRVCV